ncbi:MAG: hypothetical protein ABIK65_07865 [Candidatus Eisenbacteria bacterium]
MHRAVLIVAAFLLIAWMPALATTWYVLPDSTGDAPTIQAAIDSSSDGDTVLVAAGTYYVNLVILLKANISLIGESGPEWTILDGTYPTGGAQSRRVVIRAQGSDNLLIEGFTIREGRPNGYHAFYGGGIHVYEGRCTIRGNILRDNENTFGAAICFGWRSSETGGSVIEENWVADNLSDTCVAGAYMEGIEGPIWVRNNVFTGNVGRYAAVRSLDTELFVQANLCTANVAEKYCVRNEYGVFWAEGNLLIHNDASGIASREGTIRGNTCVENTGYGLVVGYGNLYNNISAGNGLDGISAYNAGNVTCNDSWGNGGQEYSFLGTISDTTGNNSADPLFCNPLAGDYSIASESPCAPGNSGGCGLIGALPVGCTATSVPAGSFEPSSWGRVKKLFR